ncbi:MAG: hypothetical protein JWN94_4268 [Betaproteobacteria bacterium]|nr:hypothetical protein [Betaproteobacteria bacterium]
MVVGALVVGTVLGLIPFFVGRHCGQTRFAIVALVTSIVAGVIAGIIGALPVALIFTVVIFIKRRDKKSDVEVGAASDV